MIVFEERGPPDLMTTQRVAPRSISSSNGAAPGAAFASPNAAASLAPMPGGLPASPPGPLTSPWAIVLINRADLPVSVEQRLFH